MYEKKGVPLSASRGAANGDAFSLSWSAKMYLIRLGCSCSIELPLLLTGPRFLPSPSCAENHSQFTDVRNKRIDHIVAAASCEFDFDDEELFGDEIFH